MTTEKHDPWALLREAYDILQDEGRGGAWDCMDLANRIFSALEIKEQAATFTVGNGNGTACTLCNVGGVETGVVIDTMPPMYGMRCPSCGDQWSRL